MAHTTAFALRIPPSIKEAAKTLARVHFDVPSDKKGQVNMIAFGSINDALNYLIRTGLEETLHHLDAALTKVREKHSAYEQMMKFLLDSPAVRIIGRVNFAKGSPAYQELRLIFEDDPDAGDQITREDVTYELHTCQHWLERLTEAKGAIQRALTQH